MGTSTATGVDAVPMDVSVRFMKQPRETIVSDATTGAPSVTKVEEPATCLTGILLLTAGRQGEPPPGALHLLEPRRKGPLCPMRSEVPAGYLRLPIK